MSPENTNVHGGTQAVKVRTLSSDALIGQASGLVYQELTGTITDPQNVQISFWYKYLQMGSDNGMVTVNVFDTLAAGISDDHMLWTANFAITSTTNSWTQHTFSGLQDPTPGDGIEIGTPNKFVIFGMSSYQDQFGVPTLTDGTTLWVDDVQLMHGSSAGITEKQVQAFSVFPNPCVNEINVHSEENIMNVEIISMDGKTVVSEKVEKCDWNTNIDYLQKGNYILKICSEDKIQQIKFVKV